MIRRTIEEWAAIHRRRYRLNERGVSRRAQERITQRLKGYDSRPDDDLAHRMTAIEWWRTWRASPSFAAFLRVARRNMGFSYRNYQAPPLTPATSGEE